MSGELVRDECIIVGISKVLIIIFNYTLYVLLKIIRKHLLLYKDTQKIYLKLKCFDPCRFLNTRKNWIPLNALKKFRFYHSLYRNRWYLKRICIMRMII